jgi:hypothetical protein
MRASDEAKKRRDPGDGEVMVDKAETDGDGGKRKQRRQKVKHSIERPGWLSK